MTCSKSASNATNRPRRDFPGTEIAPAGFALRAAYVRNFGMELPDVKDGIRMDNRRNSFGYDELLACARGELFGSGNAQLPLPPMLMFDRISEIAEAGGEYGKGLIRAELDVKPDLWFFGCHFKNDPVMPGCLGSLDRKSTRLNSSHPSISYAVFCLKK